MAPTTSAGRSLRSATERCSTSLADVAAILLRGLPQDGFQGGREGFEWCQLKRMPADCLETCVRHVLRHHNNAGERTRTSKGFRPPAPKAGVSASSTTPAQPSRA